MQKAIKLFKIDKFNHVLTATFLVYTSLLCAVYAYLLFQAVHEIENQAAQIYLQNAQVEVLKELNTIELPLSSNLAEDLTSVSDDELIKKLIEHFKQSRPKLRIYSSITANNPEYLSPLTIGFHEYQPEDAQILVSALPERNIKLYLVYDETNASNLDENTPNLIAGLSTVAILICLFGIMVSIALGKKIAEPLKKLTQEVSKEQPQLPLIGHNRADEIGTLSRSFTASIARAKQFLYREKQFSRHVSHELRTPLAIIGNCVSLMKLEHATDGAKATALVRIERAAGNMAQLIETFLLLGREHQNNNLSNINLRQAILTELDKIDSTNARDATSTKILICHDSIVQSDQALLGILLNNLLRNALASSNRLVRLTLSDNQLLIDNDIVKNQSTSVSGFGYGTEIMTRIAECLHCKLTIEKSEQRYRVIVTFT
ncbi:Sensory transduction protein kinase [Shewanella piezotolerans WP3]|uniref:histidine kinase n=1 Tax=Shewanella piezotolerans (strain WP3 / JCM 13877) TaxID=225849 RepID=B8CPS8_SHEPW|nr:Sensory transduction protein kinase [Shewanella piezotolerans WP3]